MHAVDNILGFLDPGCDGRLERIEVLKKCLELGFVRVPAVELLLVICPALLRGGVGVVKPIKSGLDLRLHLFQGGKAFLQIDTLRVKLRQEPVPDDLGDDAGNGDLRAVIADAGLADAGCHVHKMAHEHDGGVVRKCVDGQRSLNDDHRQGIFVVKVIGGIFAQIADRASADADDDILALKVALDDRGVLGGRVNDAVRLADDEPLGALVGARHIQLGFFQLDPGGEAAQSHEYVTHVCDNNNDINRADGGEDDAHCGAFTEDVVDDVCYGFSREK